MAAATAPAVSAGLLVTAPEVPAASAAVSATAGATARATARTPVVSSVLSARALVFTPAASISTTSTALRVEQASAPVPLPWLSAPFPPEIQVVKDQIEALERELGTYRPDQKIFKVGRLMPATAASSSASQPVTVPTTYQYVGRRADYFNSADYAAHEAWRDQQTLQMLTHMVELRRAQRQEISILEGQLAATTRASVFSPGRLEPPITSLFPAGVPSMSVPALTLAPPSIPPLPAFLSGAASADSHT
eukprot:jgi/Chrzof1/2824/Cz12g00060.t1